MAIKFFMPMNPPTVTAQMHKVNHQTGKFYDPPELKAAKAKLEAHLAQHLPEAVVFAGAVELRVCWCFPAGTSHKDGSWKITKPDTDNLQKALKDCMTRVGFWTDDALVCCEIVQKRWALTPGIMISIRELDDAA
jgi:Holliday junction resolvase RusA-like endonuclease